MIETPVDFTAGRNSILHFKENGLGRLRVCFCGTDLVYISDTSEAQDKRKFFNNGSLLLSITVSDGNEPVCSIPGLGTS